MKFVIPTREPIMNAPEDENAQKGSKTKQAVWRLRPNVRNAPPGPSAWNPDGAFVCTLLPSVLVSGGGPRYRDDHRTVC